jgi:L,D-transpeptidase YbiS
MATYPQKLDIDVGRQSLTLFQDDHPVKTWPVSTGRNGTGQQEGSGQTPLGLHIVRACIGTGLPRCSVLVGRRPTGEIWTPALQSVAPERDWILSRILWLSGLEPGYNRLGQTDTMRRYIYIHGTPDTEPMGRPLSHGCIRMQNDDVIELFERTDPGALVWIHQ